MDQSIIPDTERVAYRQARNMLSRTYGMRTQSFEQAERMSLIPSPSERGVRGEGSHAGAAVSAANPPATGSVGAVVPAAISAPGSLAQLQQTARDRENIFALLMEAVKYNSLGRISHALYEVGGEYRRNM